MASTPAETIHVLLLDADPVSRGRTHLTLMRLGHRCEIAWEIGAARSLLAARRVEALVAMIGHAGMALGELGALIGSLSQPRRVALIGIVGAAGPGVEDSVANAGFECMLTQPVADGVLDTALRRLALPLRPPPALDAAHRALIRAGGGPAALILLDKAVTGEVQRLNDAMDLGSAAITAVGRDLAAACAAAGYPAAAAEAWRLADQPERPYLRRAFGTALAAARLAVRAEGADGGA